MTKPADVKKGMELSLALSKKESTQKIIIDSVIVLLFSVGIWGSIFSMFELPYSEVLIASLVLTSPLIFFILLSRLESAGVYVLLGITALSAVLYETTWASFLALVNNAFDSINAQGSFALVPFSTSSTDGTLALALLVISLSLLIAYGVLHRNRLILFACASFAFIGLFFGAEPTLAFYALIFCAWLGLEVPGIRSIQSGGGVAITGAIVLVFVAGFFVIFSSLYSSENLRTPSQVGDAKGEITAAYQTFRYERPNAEIFELNGGNIADVKNLDYTGNIALYLTMEKPNPVFLRGFIGGEYDQGRWASLPMQNYAGEFLGLFEWLGQNGFYPQYQLSYLGGYERESRSSEITIRNTLLNSRYVYTPYEAMPNSATKDEIKPRLDQILESKALLGTREYSFDSYSPFAQDYGTKTYDTFLNLLKDSPSFTEYQKLEKMYRSFVYSNYLGIPEQESLILEEELSTEALQTMRGRDHRQVVRYIRKYFDENMSYQPNNLEYSKKEDPLRRFFAEKQGHDMHFATVATLMLREAGIPARYVEGFYLPESEVEIYEEETQVEFAVPDSLAHAWTEIYINEIGWVPVEVTPGFFTLAEETTDEDDFEDQVTKRPTYLIAEEQGVSSDADSSEVDSGSGTINWLLLLPFVFITLFSLFVILGRMRLRRIKMIFVSEDTRKSILLMGKHLTRLLKFDGIKVDRSLLYESVQIANERYKGQDLKEVLDFVYMARFSHDLPTREQVEGMNAYLEALSVDIYVKQKWPKRFAMRYLLFLY